MERIRTSNNPLSAQSSKGIDIGRSVLLAGVVMIHTNVVLHVEPEVGAWWKGDVIDPMMMLLSFCVPFFFCISGYLFFANIERFGPQEYKRKLLGRVWSLLIPYLLWNTVFAVVRFLKARYLGYDGEEICVDGQFSIIGFLRGYWDTGGGFPVDGALWFLRNLILYQLATPLVALIGRYWILTAAVMCVPLFGMEFNGDIYINGFEYFVFGAALGIHKINLANLCRKRPATVALLIAATAVAISFYSWRFITVLRYAAFLTFVPMCISILHKWPKASSIALRNTGAIFFIYAIHALYCILMRRVSNILIGYASLPAALAGWALSFVLTFGLSVLIFLALQRVAPRLLNLLSGMRLKSAGRSEKD